MKKNLLMLALCSCALAINAQNVRTIGAKLPQSSEMVPETMKFTAVQTQTTSDLACSETMTKAGAMKRMNANKMTRAGESPLALVAYAPPTGAMYAGIESEGLYYSRVFMYTPALKDVTYPALVRSQDTETPVSVRWTIGTGAEQKVMETNENGDGIASMFGNNEAPVLTATQGSFSESYQMMDEDNKPAIWFGGTDTLTSLSNACTGYGVYDGFQNGPSFTTNTVFYDTNQKLIGFAQTLEKPIENLYVTKGQIALKADATMENVLGGQTLTFTLCKFEGENLVPYAKATATEENVTWIGTSGIFIVEFPFMEEDELFGKVESPVIVGEETFILVEGFDKITTPITALFSGADGWNGNGYALLADGSISTVGYSNAPNTPQVNLHIGFTAAMPVAEPVTPEQTVYFPVEGGAGVTGIGDDGKPYNDYIVYTLSGPGQWNLVAAPEWASGLEVDDSYLSNGIIAFYFAADALPAGETHRSGNIVLELYGKQVVIPVLQGQDPNSIEDVTTSANAKAPVYNLMGQKVNVAAKGLLIKDGKKFIKK